MQESVLSFHLKDLGDQKETVRLSGLVCLLMGLSCQVTVCGCLFQRHSSFYP